jgi:hypothetical protein
MVWCGVRGLTLMVGAWALFNPIELGAKDGQEPFGVDCGAN